MATFDGNILYSLGIYVLWFIGLVIPWLFIRKRFPDMYFPREKTSGIQRTLVSWIPPVIRLKGEELYQQCGRKGVLYLRWKFQSLLFMVILMITGCVFIPIYYHLAPESETLFSSTSASSLASDSLMLWVTFAYSISIAVGFVILMIWHRKDIQKTKLLSASFDRETFNRVLQITSLPYSLDSNEDLRQRLETLTDRNVKKVSIAWKTKNIDTLQSKKLHAQDILQIYREEEQIKGHPVLFHPPYKEYIPGILCNTDKVPAVSWYENRVEKLTHEVEKVYRKAETLRKHTKTAFIIFETRYDAQMVLMNWDEMKKNDSVFEKCNLEQAKPHEEIIWENLDAHFTDHSARKFTFDIILIVLAFFWTIPIAFLSNLNNLTRIPFIGQYMEDVLDWNLFLTNLVEQLLPVILTWLFHQLLPRFCTFLSSYEKPKDVTNLHASAMEKYWIFVILNGFVFYLLFSSGIDFIQMLVNNPGEFKLSLENLDWSLYGSFYCTYLLTMAFIDSSLSHWRFKDLVKKYFRWLTTEHKTPKRREMIFASKNFSYHFRFAKESLYFAMIMTFAPIVPLVSLCATLAYIFNYLADKEEMVLISSRDPAHGKKLFSRFGYFLNGSISLTFFFWTFFFLSHGDSVISYLAAPVYLILLISCFLVLYYTGKQKYNVDFSSLESSLLEGDVEEEKYYTWEYMASPRRGLNELNTI